MGVRPLTCRQPLLACAPTWTWTGRRTDQSTSLMLRVCKINKESSVRDAREPRGGATAAAGATRTPVCTGSSSPDIGALCTSGSAIKTLRELELVRESMARSTTILGVYEIGDPQYRSPNRRLSRFFLEYGPQYGTPNFGNPNLSWMCRCIISAS